MSVSPFPIVATLAWLCLLLLLCLLAAGCAARGRSTAVPTPTLAPLTVPTFTATPTARPTRRPTFTPTPTLTPTPTPTLTPTVTPTSTPTLTPSAQVEGVYANLEVHPGGSYRLQRRGDRVEANLVSTSSAVQHAARQQPQVLFTLPPAFRPPFPILRRVVGQPVLGRRQSGPRQSGAPPLPPAARAGRARTLPGPP